MTREQQPPQVQFLAVKITCSIINTRNLSVICTRPGVSLVLRPNLSHISELLRIYTMRHLHCTLRFSFFCSTIMTWSHSGPLSPPTIFYKHTRSFEGGRWSPRTRFPKLHIKPFEQFEGSRTFTIFIKPLLPKKRTEQPCVSHISQNRI